MPVQFDEREEETEQRQTGLRRPGENLTHCHREAKATAPLLDSTHRDCSHATTVSGGKRDVETDEVGGRDAMQGA